VLRELVPKVDVKEGGKELFTAQVPGPAEDHQGERLDLETLHGNVAGLQILGDRHVFDPAFFDHDIFPIAVFALRNKSKPVRWE
jgi:hypothetical protein